MASLQSAQRAGYDEARIDYHAGLPVVNTPVIRQVIGTSRLLIQLNRHQVSARRGVVISGASGTGKTTALSQLGRAHELAARKRQPQDRHRLPVVYITVPPAATPRMVAVEFARFFGLPAPARANLTDVTNAVCATASRTKVDLGAGGSTTSAWPPGPAPRCPTRSIFRRAAAGDVRLRRLGRG